MSQTVGGANDNDGGAEVVEPDCYGFIDITDPSCRRCKVKDGCVERQLEIRPECFGVEWSDEDVECQACLVASQCADAMEDNEMRRKVRMRKAPTAATKPEPEEELVEAEEEVEAEPNADDYTELDVAQLRAECEERGLDPTGRKSVLVRRLLADDAGDENAEDEEEEEAEPQPVKREIKRRVVEKAVPQPKPQPEPEPEPEEEDVDFSFDALLDALDDGKTLIVKVTEDGYQVSMTSVAVATATVVPQTKKLRGDDFWREVLDPEYYKFNYEDAGNGKGWYDMSPEEKVNFADELGVEWEEKDDDKVTMMNMVRAIFKELGLAKYKPEYKSASARNALK